MLNQYLWEKDWQFRQARLAARLERARQVAEAHEVIVDGSEIDSRSRPPVQDNPTDCKQGERGHAA